MCDNIFIYSNLYHPSIHTDVVAITYNKDTNRMTVTTFAGQQTTMNRQEYHRKGWGEWDEITAHGHWYYGQEFITITKVVFNVSV